MNNKRKTVKNIFEANEKKIDAFKEKMEEVGQEIQAKYGKEVAALEQNKRYLKKKLKDYKAEGENKLGEFKKNLKHDMHGIGRTMKALFKDNH
jgi:predicted RNase H-like nuclease (RuvC/YqgF family)